MPTLIADRVMEQFRLIRIVRLQQKGTGFAGVPSDLILAHPQIVVPLHERDDFTRRSRLDGRN